MLGTLNKNQIEELLGQQVTGRLGCQGRGHVYIVPVNYVYRDSIIYAHATKGKKIDMMRKNPHVCFQVDDIQSIFNWESVIAWGKFEEITDPDEKQQAMQALVHRIMPLNERPTDHPSHAFTDNEADLEEKVENIVYKITLTEKTGRFEK